MECEYDTGTKSIRGSGCMQNVNLHSVRASLFLIYNHVYITNVTTKKLH